MATVARLNVTPVKSTRLQHPDRVELTADGLPENRLFYLVDPMGALFTAGDVGELQQVRSAWDGEADLLRLTFPDRAVVEGSGSALGEAVVTDFYGRPVPGRVVEGPFAGAIRRFIGRNLRLIRCDRPGDAYDVEPITVVGLASVAALAAGARHDGELDARRFRMNIELEGTDPYEEDSWDGCDVRIGGAVLRIGEQVPRCVVTTLDPMTGHKDFATLTEIARQRGRIVGGKGLPFGVYARVVEPGTVAVGDVAERLG
ncbi:MAG TPA: MOSC domain-containing protein [Actinomycetota bacterium]|nr:MOSC domain-containing protein [Actinomycetota bacterium]